MPLPALPGKPENLPSGHRDSREWHKKTGVIEYPKGIDHAGLLFNYPSGTAGLVF